MKKKRKKERKKEREKERERKIQPERDLLHGNYYTASQAS